MQVITSAIKSLGSDLWRSFPSERSTWDKIAYGKSILENGDYDQFQNDKLPLIEKRRLLKDHLLTLNEERVDDLFKSLPGMLPDQNMRSSLFQDVNYLLSQGQIHQLQLSADVSLKQLIKLVKLGNVETNRRIIGDTDWRDFPEASLRKVFKTVAMMDASLQLITPLFLAIASDIVPQSAKYHCARACFKQYKPDHCLAVLKTMKLSSEMIAAYPQMHLLDPSQLSEAHSSMRLQQIFQVWIEHADEHTLFLAKGRREVWGISPETLKEMVTQIHKLLPRQLVKTTYHKLSANDKLKLKEKKFPPEILRSADAHIRLCWFVVQNPAMLDVIRLQRILLPLLCRTAELERHFRPKFVELIKDRIPFFLCKQELFQVIFNNVLELCTKYSEEDFLSLLRHFDGSPQLFLLILKLAKHHECHLFLLLHISEFGLNPEEKRSIALKMIKHGPIKHVKALLEVLAEFGLTPESTVYVIFKCLSRFPQLAVQPLIHLHTYRLRGEFRQDFLLRWNEKYLDIYLDDLLDKYFERLTLKTQEFERVFMDAFSGMDVTSFKSDSILFKRMKEFNFPINIRKEFLRCALSNQPASDGFPFELFKLTKADIQDIIS